MSQAGLLTRRPSKPFIVSVTGTPLETASCLQRLIEIQNQPENHRWKPDEDYSDLELMMEINLSCPNIVGKPPPAYDGTALAEYVGAIAEVKTRLRDTCKSPVHVGIKTPPYTYHGQFQTLISCLEETAKLEGGCPVSFITATNTLGSCLVLDEAGDPALGSANGMGLGGMAGDALHPLALGNVKTIRSMLDASSSPDLHRISIIGIGGVRDAAGFKRMRGVGAAAVGVGTALGREGIEVFEKISEGDIFTSKAYLDFEAMLSSSKLPTDDFDAAFSISSSPPAFSELQFTSS
jgi:dihydroorotate dehydrogenase (fumarate)